MKFDAMMFFLCNCLFVSYAVRPSWSWNTLSTFLHTSNTSGLFSEEELDSMVKFDMITIEKWQGEKFNIRTAGYTDKRIIDQCREIKKRNPHIPCIMYWDTNTVWDCRGAGPPGFCAGRGLDNVAYEGAVTAELHPDDFLLHQPNGSLYVSGYVNGHVIDFRKPKATDLWIETCTNATKTGVVDGCFVDFCSWGLSNTSYPGFTEAHHSAVNKITKAMGSKFLTIGNNCQRDTKQSSVMSTPSAVFIEGFQNTSGSFSQLAAYVNTTIWPTKPVVQIHFGSHDCWNRAKGMDAPGCNNTLAAAMVLMRENVFIGLGMWRTVRPTKLRLLPEFSKPLGKPTGPATINADGVYIRNFSSGTSASFNPVTGLGNIYWAAAI